MRSSHKIQYDILQKLYFYFGKKVINTIITIAIINKHNKERGLIMKKIMMVCLICAVMCLSLTGCDSKNNIPTDVNYQTVTLKDMYQVYDQNRARFEEQYKDQYLSIKGEVSYIGADDYFSIDQYIYDYAGNRTGRYASATARVKNDSLKSLVLELNEGDTVTIKGKVVDFSYTVGCDVKLDVYEMFVN